ncbi:MAG: SUMF1/EgtB/PvdO family nonheme iron enzyme, partial [Desulfobacteraceae bacterium]|nr:SUMF1/EgtB/PvdO family nonheme iron enzyme [Desulfobacteraceae bacterium]
MASLSISLEGINQAITGLAYKENSKKHKVISAIKAYYVSEKSINDLISIDTDNLIKKIWDLEETPSKIRTKRRNFSSLKSSINLDLKKLSDKGKNPENIVITDANTFDMSEEAKANLLNSFSDALKTGDVDIDQASSILSAITDFLDTLDPDKEDDKSADLVNQIKKVLDKISSNIIPDEDTDSGGTAGIDGTLGKDAIEEIDEDIEEIDDYDEDIEEIELDEDEEIEEIDDLDDIEEVEDIEEDVLDEDIEEVELDEDEDYEDEDYEDEELEEIEAIDDDIEELELDEDEDYEDEDEDLEEIDDYDEDTEEIELDDDEEIEEIDDLDDIEEVEDIEDDDIEEIELDDYEDHEDEELEELEEIDGIDDDIEELELDEDEDLEEIEDYDEDTEEIELDDDEELKQVDELTEEEIKALEEFHEKKKLAEQFDDKLSDADKKYNTYVLVPAGEYTIGTKKTLKSSLELQKFDMPQVYIGKFPITNSLFEAFVEETGYITTAEKTGSGNVFFGKFKKEEKTKTSVWKKNAGSSMIENACWYQPEGPESSIHGKKHHPVVQVSVDDAFAFASWIGRRLPTETEWEAAARTDLGYKYPWGNKWKDNACNIDKNGMGGTTAVDYYADYDNEFKI